MSNGLLKILCVGWKIYPILLYILEICSLSRALASSLEIIGGMLNSKLFNSNQIIIHVVGRTTNSSNLSI